MEKNAIIKAAEELGFACTGFTTAEPLAELEHLCKAISTGRISEMAWLSRDPEKRCDPSSLLFGAKSVICCAMRYGENGIEVPLLCKEGKGEVDRDLPPPTPPYKGGENMRARFARGEDYHVVMREKLTKLWEIIKKDAPNARAKICVDTSPIMEKALAARAGIGWIGKHTILVNRDIGSWFVLGEIIADIELEPDKSYASSCGECRACIDSCPTHALKAPYVLDSGRCISYLTIETKKPAPEDIRNFIPEGAYGCDICQEVCPYNKEKL